MKTRVLLSASMGGIAALAAVAVATAQAPPPSPPPVPPGPVAIPPARLAAAKAVAGPDLANEAQGLCMQAWVSQGHRDGSKNLVTSNWTPAEPTRVFDNLYWMGFKEIGAWALKTDKGIIMFDSLTTPQEAETVLVPQMKKLGLDPLQIKYVIISHGHFDHFGGAAYLQRTYGARVAMGAPDLQYVQESRPFDPPAQAVVERPKWDIAVKDQDSITLGHSKVVMFLAPGHTPGSLAIVIPTKDHGRPIKVVLSGGGLPLQTRLNLDSFTHNLALAAGPQGIVAQINSHPGANIAKMAQIRADPDGRNPIIWGKDKMNRYFKAAAECTADRLSG